MIRTLAAYIIAFVVVAGMEPLFLPVMPRLLVALRKTRWPVPLVIGLLDFVKVVVAVCLAAWLIHAIRQSPAWLMFLIPVFIMLQSSLLRAKAIKERSKRGKRMIEDYDEPLTAEQTRDLQIEQAHLLGGLAGWLVGVNLALGWSASLW